MASAVATSRVRRWAWFGAGWCAVGVGSIGIVVPGLPTTVFFIVAASCFARSSPRFERWVLDLPRIGPMVRDHRAGLGMRRRAKGWAIATIVVVGALSMFGLRERVWLAAFVFALLLAGIAYIVWRVPTRERVVSRTPRT
jgi:uncharacterized membrane protein YbaN (DUF454 family)